MLHQEFRKAEKKRLYLVTPTKKTCHKITSRKKQRVNKDSSKTRRKEMKEINPENEEKTFPKSTTINPIFS